MLCRNCYREVPDGSKFCSECGARLGENGKVLQTPSQIENDSTESGFVHIISKDSDGVVRGVYSSKANVDSANEAVTGDVIDNVVNSGTDIGSVDNENSNSGTFISDDDHAEPGSNAYDTGVTSIVSYKGTVVNSQKEKRAEKFFEFIKNYKKLLIVSAACLLLIMVIGFLTTMGKIKMDYAASDFVGRNYEEVINELTEKGFTVFENTEIDDLTSNGGTPDGAIELLSINGNSGFKKKTRFSKKACVAIKYHTIKKFIVPFAPEDIVKNDVADVSDRLKQTGFTNVKTEERKDLDPDSFEDDFKNVVEIDGRPFSKDKEYPFDAAVVVVRHFPYKKYDVSINVEFSWNLLFSKYGVDVYIDHEKITSLSHAEDWNSTLRLKEGTHRITFAKDSEGSIKGTASFEVTSNTEASFKIKTHSDRVDVATQYIKAVPNADEVINTFEKEELIGKDYKEVEQILRDLGFVNIKVESNNGFDANYPEFGVVDVVMADGDFQKDAIYMKNSEVTVLFNEQQKAIQINQDKSFEEKLNETPSGKAETAAVFSEVTSDEQLQDEKEVALEFPFEFDDNYTRMQNYYLYLDVSRGVSLDTIEQQAKQSGINVSVKDNVSEESGKVVSKELTLSVANERIWAEYWKNNGRFEYHRMHYYVTGNEKNIQIYNNGKKNGYSISNDHNWADNIAFSSLKDAIDGFYMPDGKYVSRQDQFIQVTDGKKSKPE